MELGTATDFAAGSKSDMKILVVDDDDLNRRMMKVLLGREGYHVDLATNGLEALDAVKYQHYSMVLMDLQMPIMDGVEASRRIREWEKDGTRTFIVALTASYMPQEGHVLYEAGIDNYISKPFDFEQIQRMLQYAAAGQTDALIPPERSTSETGTVTEKAKMDIEANHEKKKGAS
jgi:CheY-like chemotaxis protein